MYEGNDWCDGDKDGGPESVGLVFHIHDDASVGVRLMFDTM